MNWSDSSEIVLGLILDHRLSVNSVRPELFIEPYNKAIKLLQKTPELSIEDLIMQTGLSPIQGAFDQVHKMNGLGEKDWIKILESSATLYDAGAKMGKMSQRLMQGDDVDWSQITGFAKRAQESLAKDLVPLSQIKSGEIPFVKTGWKAFDNHTGGLPEVGLVVVGGRPKKGKTWFMTRITTSFIREHPIKNVAVFSFEMMFPEIAARLRKTDKVGKGEERLYVCEQPHTAEEVLNICATIPELGLVAIDFVDLMIVGSTDESSMSQIYRTLMLGAKTLRCPIILLSQLNRAGTGIPRPQDLRWTGLAEAFAWMILMIHEPSTEWTRKDKEHEKDDQTLPTIEGTGYVIVWGSRGGFPMHPDDYPGAIQMPFDGRHGGWSEDKSRWWSLKNVS